MFRKSKSRIYSIIMSVIMKRCRSERMSRAPRGGFQLLAFKRVPRIPFKSECLPMKWRCGRIFKTPSRTPSLIPRSAIASHNSILRTIQLPNSACGTAIGPTKTCGQDPWNISKGVPSSSEVGINLKIPP